MNKSKKDALIKYLTDVADEHQLPVIRFDTSKFTGIPFRKISVADAQGKNSAHTIVVIDEIQHLN